jgi:capsular exopolysaccharide synthesis family protein
VDDIVKGLAMNRFFSVFQKMDRSGQRTPTLNLAIPKFIVDEQALTDLDRQTIEFVLDKAKLPDGSDQEASRDKVRRQKGRTEGRTVIDAYRQINERAVAFHKFDTVEAEQYRKLYIEIVHARRTRELQIILLTSALAGEGKSITALNLAITSAAAGDQHGVLLVDTDLRKPSIHRYLGIHPRCGLSDYLLGDTEYSQIFFKTQIPGLTIIAAGRRVSNPTTLLASTRMEQLFRDIKSQKQYSSIILDSSPVLLTSESKVLLQYVDTTILVVRAKKTPTEVISQTIKILGEENVLGCVLNGVTFSDFPLYNYYYNNNYYNSGSINDSKALPAAFSESEGNETMLVDE